MAAPPPSSTASAHFQQVEKLLRLMVDNGGSEIRLSAVAPPMLQIDGSMKPVKSQPLTTELVAALAAAVIPAGAQPSSFVFTSSLG